MQDKLIEAAQHVVDEMERGYPILGPVCRLKEALAAVRAHDAGTDEGLPTDHRPCPNCGRSDGWHYALGHAPLPVGDSRKIVWMRDKDEMEWWGVRAYNHAEGYWQSNRREESSTVLFWMETPHSPHYPPASHAAESAPPSLKNPEHSVDELAQRIINESPHTSSCAAYRETARRLYDTINPVHESTAQLDAEDQHRATEPVTGEPTAWSAQDHTEEYVQQGYITEPVEDVIYRMCRCLWFDGQEPDNWVHLVTAALAVAREGYWSQQAVEKAIRELEFKYDVSRWTTDYFITELRASLAPKPSLAEEFAKILERSAHLVIDMPRRNKLAEELAALVERRTK